MIKEKINNIFPSLNYEYLCLNDIPRIRILFPKYNLNNIKENNKRILFESFNETKVIYWAISFFSNNSKKINKKNYNNIYSAWLYWILDKWELHVHHIEERFFLHTYFLKLDISDVIFLSEIIIKSNHMHWDNSNIPYIDWVFAYFFDLNSNFIINVYWFEWIDICSYDKKYLYYLRDLFKKDFEVLDDKIDID